MPRPRRRDPGLTRLDQIQAIRDRYPLPARLADMYDSTDGIRGEYIDHTRAEATLQKLHRRAGERVTASNNDLTPGLRQALRQPLIWAQISRRYPWEVRWVRVDPHTGRRRTGSQKHSTLGGAILAWRRIRRLAPTATVISRVRAYDIPPPLRGTLPREGFAWCPRCMKPRRFQATGRTVEVQKKTYNTSKQRWEWLTRRVNELSCPMCHTTNRDPVYRRSNQPWHTRRYRARPRTPAKRQTKR